MTATALAAAAALASRIDAATDVYEHAACRGVPADLFYPPGYPRGRTPGNGHPDPWAEARKVCNRCPVRAACLEFALANREPFGMWGGRDETERRTILRQRRMAAS
jgi:WhiB family redox-sensing transcriptional regulator